MKVIIGIISSVLAYWIAPVSKFQWLFLVVAAIIYFILTKLVAAIVRHRKAIIGAAAAVAVIAILSGGENVGSIVLMIVYFGCVWGLFFKFIFPLLLGARSRTVNSITKTSAGIVSDVLIPKKPTKADIEAQRRRQAKKNYWFNLKQEEYHRYGTGDKKMEEYYKDKRRTAYDDWSK